MRWSTALLCALLASGSRIALADSAYPAAVQSNLSLSYVPPCTICHTTTVGKAGTATTDFATALKGRGISVGGDLSTVPTALDQMTADKVDSDGDGVIDTDQLKAGRDPNTGVSLTGDGLMYGCGAQVAAGDAGFGAPWLAAGAAVMGLLAARRRRADRG